MPEKAFSVCIKDSVFIDPPYNTGNDFVYEDDFAQSTDEYLANSGQFDENGNRMVQNTESNGRFHTDWLNMIYPRLRLAKDLLSEQGVLVISIDDNEIDNMRKCCNDIFGEDNLVNCFVWNCSTAGGIRPKFASKTHEYILAYAKNKNAMDITYNPIEGGFDSGIFTADKSKQAFDKAFRAEKAIQDYVFTDGSAEQSIERKFAQDLDAAVEVCVYAKLPKGFHIPTPVGNYSPDWAIAFYEGTVKHIFFVAETKGTMESLNLRPIEQAKISCAKKLFNEMSNSQVRYHDVDSYQSLLDIMNSMV